MSDTTISIEEITDPAEIARFRAGRARHARNEVVFREQMIRLYRECRGKVIMVAGQELHVSDSADEAWAWARRQHPEDDAVLVRYIPKEKGPRIYGHATHRRVV